MLPAVQFSGTQAVSPARLKQIALEELSHLLGEVQARAAVDDSAFVVAEYYRSIGYPDVDVVYTWTPPCAEEENGLIQYEVTEGRRTVVSEFVFAGNASIGSKELTGLYTGPTTGPLGTGMFVYEESRSLAFSDKVEELYYERGFLDVRVEKPIETWGPENTQVVLSYTVQEGPQHRLREVSFEGVTPAQELELAELVQNAIGQSYLPSVLFELRGRILEYFAENGYPNTKVSGQRLESDEPEQAELSFSVTPGEQIRIHSVVIRGNERTRESTIRALVALREGELYSLKHERESFEALYGSGLFKSVKLTLEPHAANSSDLIVQLEESGSASVFVEPGYGSYEKVRIRAGVRDSNMFGLGHTGRAEMTLGFLAQQFELGYTDPFLFKSKLELDISSYWTRREEPSFLRREAGVGTTLTRRFSEIWRLSLGYRFRRSIADEVEVIDPATLATEEPINVSSVTLTPTHDSRDGVFTPTKGALSRVILEYAGTALGSEIDFVRVRGNWSNFQSLRNGTVLAMAARTGVIKPLGATLEIPIQERFFNGGEMTVRSFRQDELGLLDASGAPIGGEAFTTLNAELRQDVIPTLQVAAFADTGNVVADTDDYFKFEGFRHALGVGVRYLLPIGPLRLDWGWNPNPRDIEEDWVLHLSVGMAF